MANPTNLTIPFARCYSWGTEASAEQSPTASASAATASASASASDHELTQVVASNLLSISSMAAVRTNSSNQQHLFSVVTKFNELLKEAEEKEENRCCCSCTSTPLLRKINEVVEIAYNSNSWWSLERKKTYTQGVAQKILDHIQEDELLPHMHLVCYLLRNDNQSASVQKLFKIFAKNKVHSFLEGGGDARQAEEYVKNSFGREFAVKLERTFNKPIHEVVKEITGQALHAFVENSANVARAVDNVRKESMIGELSSGQTPRGYLEEQWFLTERH